VSPLPSWLATGPALEPIDDPYDMHRRGIQGLLEVGAGQSDIATPAEIEATYALRQGALHAGPQGILGFKPRRLLPLPRGLHGHMLRLRPDSQLAWGLFGPGAGTAHLTGTARRGVKTHAHDRPPAPIMARSPCHTGVTLGTTRLLGRPLESQRLDTIALAGTMVATRGAKRRTAHVHVMQVLGTGEALGIHRATVEYRRAREHSPLGSILLNHRPHDTIGGGRRGGQHLCDQIRGAVITGLTQVCLRADPWRVAFGTRAGLQRIRRLHLEGGGRPRVWAAPAHRFHAWFRTAIIVLHPYLPENLQPGELPQMARVLVATEALQEGIALGPNLHGQCVACARLFGESHGFGTRAIALRPRHRDVPLHPGRIGGTALMQRRPQGFEAPFEALQRPDGGQHMRGIGPLGPAGFEPATGFTRLKEGIEEPLGGVMGEQAFAKIV
jgi:hypothetical protein